MVVQERYGRGKEETGEEVQVKEDKKKEWMGDDKRGNVRLYQEKKYIIIIVIIYICVCEKINIISFVHTNGT